MTSNQPNGCGDIAQHLLEMLAAGDTKAALVAVHQLTAQRDELSAQRDELSAQRDEFEAKVAEQDGQIVWLRRMLFGRRSEKLSAEELGQLVLAYGGSETDAAAKDPTLPVPAQGSDEDPEQDKKPKKRRRTRDQKDCPRRRL